MMPSYATIHRGSRSMRSVYRLELRTVDAWRPLSDYVGLPLAMAALEDVLSAGPISARVVRARDAVPVVTIWWPRPVAAMGSRLERARAGDRPSRAARGSPPRTPGRRRRTRRRG